MKQKRIRINLEDTDGAKFKFDIEGNVTKDKVLKLFELMDLMNIEEEQAPDLDSVGGKIWNVVENHFPAGKFTSSGVLEKYEDEYNEPIKLSIISTYLARFASRNRIERKRIGERMVLSNHSYSTKTSLGTTVKRRKRCRLHQNQLALYPSR